MTIGDSITNSYLKNIKRFIQKMPIIYILLHNGFNLKKTLIDIKGYNNIKRNDLFDSRFYQKKYNDLNNQNINLLLHYIYHGAKEFKNPNKDFDTKYYMKKYKDVKKSGLNPLIHYVLYGIGEKRFINIEKEELVHKKEIIDKNMKNINLKDFKSDSPLVSIIILNRNGINHLKRLFKDFKENIQYPNYEVIVVDNASCDNSVEYLERINDIPIKIIKNKINESFSKANNKAISVSNGEFILLLNNDIETTYGWLNEMMQTLERNNYNCTVGAKLVYPKIHGKNHKESFKVQHAGMAFDEYSDGSILPYNIGNRYKPFDKKINMESKRGGVTAAVLLVKRSIYEELGGLDEDYNYGYEDVDFCLKILKNGYDNIYCPNALLFHYEYGTDRVLHAYFEQRNRGILNKAFLFYKWNKYLAKNILKEKINKEKILTEKKLNIIFLLNNENNIQKKIHELVDSINKYGWEAKIINIDEEFVYGLNNNVDILISTIPNFSPRELHGTKINLLKFGFIEDSINYWLNNPFIREYDFLLTNDNKIHEKLVKNSFNTSLASLKLENLIDFIKNNFLK